MKSILRPSGVFEPARPFRMVTLAIATLVFATATQGIAHAQNYSDLYNFGSHIGDPLAFPYTGLLAQGPDGNLYTTSIHGGSSSGGTAFTMTPSGTLTVLHSFNFTSGGAYPESGLTLGTDGNFYGTSMIGPSQEGGRLPFVRTHQCCTTVPAGDGMRGLLVQQEVISQLTAHSNH